MEPGSEFGAIVPSDTLSFVGCIPIIVFDLTATN